VSHPTREAWLQAATTELAPLFALAGYTLPPVHVSVGWPSKGGTSMGKRRAVGQCWDGCQSADGVPHVFISPTLGSDRVLDVLVHELCHAIVGSECGHKGAFVDCAKAVGLTGKMTATEAGAELALRLHELSGRLGEYPHALVTLTEKQRKPQATRMLKVWCAADDYVVRASKTTLAKGVPECPVCRTTMVEAGATKEESSDE
jgi:hypothetical protein